MRVRAPFLLLDYRLGAFTKIYFVKRNNISDTVAIFVYTLVNQV